jgi:hypothetical protein
MLRWKVKIGLGEDVQDGSGRTSRRDPAQGSSGVGEVDARGGPGFDPLGNCDPPLVVVSGI